ncbi:MAG: hypothetical protein ACK5N9_19485 [Pirellula sp.]
MSIQSPKPVTDVIIAPPRQLSQGTGAPRRPQPNRPAESTPGINIASILGAIRRHWPIATVVGLILAPLAGIAGWIALEPKHAATAFLRIDSNDTPLAFQTADRVANGIVAFKVYKNTQKQLVTSPLVLNTALADEKVSTLSSIKTSPDPMQSLINGIKVTFPDDSEVMAVELASQSISDSKIIVDAIVNAYLNEVVLAERNERVKRLENLEKAFSETEGKTRAKHAELRQIADTLGTGDSQTISLAQQTAIQQFGLLRTDLNKVSFDLLKTEGQLESVRQQIVRAKELLESAPNLNSSAAETVNVGLSELAIDEALGRDPLYQRHIAEGRELTKKIRDMERRSLGEKLIGPTRTDLAEIRRLAEERRETVVSLLKRDMEVKKNAPVVVTNASNLSGTSVADMGQIESNLVLEIGILNKQKRKLEEDIKAIEDEAKKYGRSSIDMEMMRAEIQSGEDVLKRLSAEIEATRIELKAGSRISVISNASVIEGPDLKKRLAVTAAGGMAGLFLPLIGLVAFDLRRRLIDDPAKAANELNIEVLGTVPQSRKLLGHIQSEPKKQKRNRQESGFVESVQAMVAMLVKKAKFDDKRVLMVTSAAPSEGKSTLSQNLWSGLNSSRYRCILVDMDFRRPSIHRTQKVPIGIGATDVLSGEVTLEEAIREVAPNTFVMTAGSRRTINLAALGADELPKFISDLRSQFDFVILDTPPLLPVVDGRIIGEHVDGAILSTFKDRSRLPQLVAAVETLKAHDVPVLGVVLCGFSTGTYGYGYYETEK